MEIGPFRMDPSNPAGGLLLMEWGGWEEFAGVVFGTSPSLSSLDVDVKEETRRRARS